MAGWMDGLGQKVIETLSVRRSTTNVGVNGVLSDFAICSVEIEL